MELRIHAADKIDELKFWERDPLHNHWVRYGNMIEYQQSNLYSNVHLLSWIKIFLIYLHMKTGGFHSVYTHQIVKLIHQYPNLLLSMYNILLLLKREQMRFFRVSSFSFLWEILIICWKIGIHHTCVKTKKTNILTRFKNSKHIIDMADILWF